MWQEIKSDDLPKPVREAFSFPTNGASNVEYRTWTKGGKTYYATFYTPKNSIKRMELRTDAEGKPLEDAHEIKAKD